MPDTDSSSSYNQLLARRSRQAAILGAGSLLIFVLSLGYGTYQLRQYRHTADTLQDSVDVLQTKINSGIERLQSLRVKIDSLQVIKQNLVQGIRERNPALAEKLLKRAVDSAQAAGRRPTVWIQVGEPSQRKHAQKIADQLSEQGIKVPGTEMVGALPSTAQIRFFQDSSDSLATLIRKVLEQEGYDFRPRNLSDQYEGVGPNTIEIWFPSPDSAEESDRR